MTARAVLECEAVSKSYGAVRALTPTDLKVGAGTVVALLGENGAGKSTLVKILSGALRADSGTVLVGGQRLEPASANRAAELGLRVVHQSPALAADMSVTDNVFLGSERLRRGWRLDRSAMRRVVQEHLDRLSLTAHPEDRLGDLAHHERRMIAIVRALVFNAKALVLDEPTAAMPVDQRERLFDVVRRLRDDGVGILYVTHHVDEVEALADEVVVLRDGVRVLAERRRMTASEVVGAMLGSELQQVAVAAPPAVADAEVFRFSSVSPAVPSRTTELEVAAGQLTILTGLADSGTKELAAAAYGAAPGWSTVLQTRGSARRLIRSPSDAVAVGVGYLPEDRTGRAAFGDQSLVANVSVAHLSSLTSRLRRIDRAAEQSRIEELLRSLRVKHSHLHQHVSELSGGNQQKVMLARWIFTGSRVLILDEPTQGVDVGAKAEILRLLERLLVEGKALLVVTADAEEFLGLASRVHVMQRGQIVRTFDEPDLDAREIARAVLTPQPQHAQDPRRTA